MMLEKEQREEFFGVFGPIYSPHGKNHIGIFFNQVLKDFQVRYNILLGKEAKNIQGRLIDLYFRYSSLWGATRKICRRIFSIFGRRRAD